MKEKIASLLSYDNKTGVLTWAVTRNGYVKAGKIAGTKSDKGYVCIKLEYKLYPAHRLVWILINGDIQDGMEIDHINGVRDDNRIENLRCVSKMHNLENQKKAHSNNKSSGLLGVAKLPSGRYQAAIQSNKKLYYIGSFDTAIDAYNAYLDTKRRIHKCCTI